MFDVLRLGSSAGSSESVDEQRAIDCGTLVLTSKRLAFLGSLRTNSVDLCDLISVEHSIDGIAVHREHTQKTETYVLTRPLTIADGVGRGLPIFGPMLKTAIEFAKLLREAGPEKIAQLTVAVVPSALIVKLSSFASVCLS